MKEHRIPERAKLVSFLGSLEERKNPLGILKVAELLKTRDDIHFVIAGRGDSSYAELVKEEARHLSNVTILGEITDKEKILLIKSSHINILLSQLEALGLTQLEFMYNGVPVITSAVGGQSWLVRNGKEGLHTQGPDDIHGAAHAITNLISDQELWNKLSANSRKKASNLSCSRMIKQLDDAITEEMLKENGLIQLPIEARNTIVEPENVLKTWSAGSWGAVATQNRLFIKHGRFSRKVTEIPYGNISCIEHTRRYSWKILIAGLFPAFAFLLEPLWRSILESSVVSTIEGSLAYAAAAISPQLTPQTLLALLATGSTLISVGVFAIKSRTSFTLYGSAIRPVYLPHELGGIVTFVRANQDKQDVVVNEDFETQQEEAQSI